MGDMIRVNTTRLKTDASEVLLLIRQMEKQVREIEDSTSRLNSMWEGPSKEVYVQSIAEDIERIRAVLNDLSKIQQFEDKARVKYDSCEQNVIELVNSIRV